MSEENVLQDATQAACDDAVGDRKFDLVLSDREIKRNMCSLVLLETTFWTGSADINLALTPLLVFLGASNTMIGYVSGAMFMALFGVILSPWITRRFRYKKYYLFTGNVPYLTALFVMGLLTINSRRLGLTNETLLWWVFALYLTHWFFGGFVTLPCTEFIAACIPMSHRGRLTGYAYSAAGGAAIGAAYLGQVLLRILPKPASFGFVLLLGWFLQQAGYTTSLFAKERPTPVEHSPRPYTREMFAALWRDKAYMNLLILYFFYTACFYTTTFNFINVYGFKHLKMALWLSGVMMIVAQVAKLITSAPMGLFIDRMTPKKTLPYVFIVGAAAWVSPIVIPGAYGVYAGIALGTVCVTGLISAQTALICGLPSPEHRAGHFTIQIVLNYVALAAGTITIGRMCDWFPYHMVFGIMAGISLAFFPFGRYMLRLLPDDLKSYS